MTQPNAPSDDRRVCSEFVAPVIVRKNDHGISANDLIFVRAEPAAEVRFHAKQLEEISRYQETGFELGLRLLIARDARRNEPVCDQSIERRVLVADVDDIGKRKPAVASRRAA